MVRVDKKQRDALEKAGLLRFKTDTQEANFYVTKGHHKSWYVVEEKKIMIFLGLEKEPLKKNNNKRNHTTPSQR